MCATNLWMTSCDHAIHVTIDNDQLSHHWRHQSQNIYPCNSKYIFYMQWNYISFNDIMNNPLVFRAWIFVSKMIMIIDVIFCAGYEFWYVARTTYVFVSYFIWCLCQSSKMLSQDPSAARLSLIPIVLRIKYWINQIQIFIWE